MADAPVGADSSSGRGRTVLILEDDPSVRNSMARVLELYDYRVLEAADAREAPSI